MFTRTLVSVFLISFSPTLFSKEENTKKLQEICQAAIEVSDAGWAAYSMIKFDVSKIVVEGQACIYKEPDKKCEESVSKIIANNLEHAILNKFAERYIKKLNDVCSPFIYDSNKKLKISEYKTEMPGSFIDKNPTQLIKLGYVPADNTFITLTRLPSGTSIDIEVNNFKKPGSKSVTHSCVNMSLFAKAIFSSEEDENKTQINGFFPTDVCIDLTKSSSSEETEKVLNFIFKKNNKK